MKQLFFVSIFALLALKSYAQSPGLDIGIKLMPNLSITRVTDKEDDDLREIANDGLSGRFGAGLVVDAFFANNYAFNTGLNFIVRRPSLSYDSADASSRELKHSLQYLQIPVGLKLFTNDIAVNARVYFNVAGNFDIKIAERIVEDPDNYAYDESKHYIGLDFGIIFASGAEFQVSGLTLFGGLFYNRNFLNIARNGIEGEGGVQDLDLKDEARVVLSNFGIEGGIKF